MENVQFLVSCFGVVVVSFGGRIVEICNSLKKSTILLFWMQ